ncbi:MAG: 3-dehydroquinate synthase [Flavobacteriaceae bacterium]|nr:3-dehydroquinate synthase [Flavobacteriaceae bacterium]
MKAIEADNYSIFFDKTGYSELDAIIKNNTYSKVFLLADTNTKKYCLPLLKSKINNFDKLILLEIKGGENHKDFETCQNLWQQLCDLEADRDSLLVNLGGGVVTDLGGFVAATLKRGIHFINIPTTLLGMVDASIGGKTGVNLGALKNQVGCFSTPQMIIIDTDYLSTLDPREIRSGMSEIIKYGLSYDKELYQTILNNSSQNDSSLKDIIYRSVAIKNEVVLEDPNEQDLRKVLNFGHSMGHAVESYFLKNKNKQNLTHGEAIAVGMVTVLNLSCRYCEFDKTEADKIKDFILTYFGKVDLSESEYPSLLELLKHDKKAKKGIVKFVLINRVGEYKLNCEVSEAAIIDALNYYIS